MKFSVLSRVSKPWDEFTEHTVYWQNLDQAVAAERMGFSHFWLTKQHFFAETRHTALAA